MKLLFVVIFIWSIVASVISAADTDICGGETSHTGTSTEASGTVVSPNHPANYGNSLECTLTITTEEAGITLTFSKMDVENAGGCANDYVQISVDGVDTKYCAYTIPTVAAITGKTVTIKFVTDSSATYTGFKLSWAKTGATPEVDTSKDICGGQTTYPYTGTSTDATGTVKSPNYPDNYPNSVECTLTITTENAGISLTFTNLKVENARGCANDYVQISAGTEEIGKYCAYSIPTVAAITGKTVTIKFVTDSSATHTGFELSWKGSGK